MKPWSDSDVNLKAWSDSDVTLRRGVTVTSVVVTVTSLEGVE